VTDQVAQYKTTVQNYSWEEAGRKYSELNGSKHSLDLICS
jgi:hypothetical protein